MGLLDIGVNLAAKYGPQLLKGLSSLNAPGGSSPMYPGGPAGFAAPRTTSAGSFGTIRRKKRRGLSASDIRGAQKVARLVQSFGFRPKIKARRSRRR